MERWRSPIARHPAAQVASFRPWVRLQKIRWWNAQRVAELLQAPRPDAIDAPLVFLNLLERDTGRIGEFRLAQSQQISAGTYFLSDMGVHRSCGFAAALIPILHQSDLTM